MSLGLRELIRRSKPDECPFCGDPRALKTGSKTKYQISCGDEICKAAYHHYYWVDLVADRKKMREERSNPLVRKQRAEQSRRWRQRNPEKFREQQKRYEQTEKGRAMRARANKRYYDKMKGRSA